MDRLLVERLVLEAGDHFRLGTQDFVLSAVLVREPDSATGDFGLRPPTIVRTRDLAGPGLLESGTLCETEYRLVLPEDANLDALRAEVKGELGSGVDWDDRRNAAGGVTRFVERMWAFLVLTGLAGLGVGGVGIITAVRLPRRKVRDHRDAEDAGRRAGNDTPSLRDADRRPAA